MESLAHLLALLWLTGCISIGLKYSKLNPGKIAWPKDTWVSNPIQLSQANAGESVKFTFSFTTSTALTSGILEVQLPSGLSGGPLYISSSFGQSQSISLTSSAVTLPPSEGIFGPFALITRSSSTGKIYDANNLFGFIKSTSSVAHFPLTVTNSAANPVVKSTDTLFFAFSLSQNLWKYDIFEIGSQS